jgi:hypothetical protein
LFAGRRSSGVGRGENLPCPEVASRSFEEALAWALSKPKKTAFEVIPKGTPVYDAACLEAKNGNLNQTIIEGDESK